MKEKYIDELVGSYYLFPEGLSKSDIATSKTCDDIACDIPTEAAKALVEDRNKLVAALVLAINSHGDSAGDVFNRIIDELYT